MLDTRSVEQRASNIKLLLMDCDGVLTDGRIWLFEPDDDQKGFHVRDGLGLDLWHSAGLKSGIISGRHSKAVEMRASALGVSYVRLGHLHKLQAFREVLDEAQVSTNDVAYVGDDLNDISLMMQVKLSVGVGDAVEEVKQVANYVTKAHGGYGAVREVIELILKSQGRWEELLQTYLVE